MKRSSGSVPIIHLLAAVLGLVAGSMAAPAQTPPTITQQPAAVTVLAGADAAVQVGVSGTGPFRYQWRLNGTNLPNLFLVAGSGVTGFAGDGGTATNAQFYLPTGLAADTAGNLIITDTENHAIRRVDAHGIITTVAGDGSAGFGYAGDGGSATNARLNRPQGPATDGTGNLFFADSNNGVIRRVDNAGIITTVAGNYDLGPGYAGDGAAATNARMRLPMAVLADGPGNLLIADWGNNVIRRVDTNGIITTLAGNGNSGYSGDGGMATNASLANPGGLAWDLAGNLIFADVANNRVRKVDTNGVITTVAGNGAPGFAGDGGPATEAALNFPTQVAVNADGDLFIADANNHRIRRVDAGGIITTVAGTGLPGYLGDGGAATNAQFRQPTGLALNGEGDLFIADTGNARIRELIAFGPRLVVPAAGWANAGGYDVVVTGPGGSVTSAVAAVEVLTAPFFVTPPGDVAVAVGGPASLAVNAAGTLPLSYAWYYKGTNLLQSGPNPSLDFADVRLADAGPYTVVITNLYGSVTSGVINLAVGIPPHIAGLSGARTVAAGTDVALGVTVAGTGPFSFQWQLNGTNLPDDLITTVAGYGTPGYSGDGGAATLASLKQPKDVAIAPDGSIYVADTGNGRVRQVDAHGLISSVVLPAQLNAPTGVAVDSAGNLFTADNVISRLFRRSALGVVTTETGTGTSGYSGDGGAATNARLAAPQRVVVDATGNVFFSDSGNNRVRRVDTGGTITTVAGNGDFGDFGDGGAATNASLRSPAGLSLDAAGNLFIADSFNNLIRKVDTNGIITTVAGTLTGGVSGDGIQATNASLNRPLGVAVDVAGNLFIADTQNSLIRRVDTQGIIRTVAGGGAAAFAGDGGAAINAKLNNPAAVAVDANGRMYIADGGNNRVRMVRLGFGRRPALLLDRVSTAEAGAYQAIITSPYGSVTSAVVSVVVGLPPVITVPPADVAVRSGDPASFSVTATGTAPLAYAWYFNGTNPVPAATNATLVLTNVTTAQSGSYAVVISNLFGSVTSPGATLSVGEPPGLTNPPVDLAVLAGARLSLSVAPVGPGPFSYQWLLNGTNLPNNLITTFAGTGKSGYSGDGGFATNAVLNSPQGVTVDADGNVIIADYGNNRLRKVAADGRITTILETTSTPPIGATADSEGNLFFAEFGNHRIFQLAPDGTLTSPAGLGVQGFAGDEGPAIDAKLSFPRSVALDAFGNLFVADLGNSRIRRVDPFGIITTVAGGGQKNPGNGGAATNAVLGQPVGLVTDGQGNLFVAELGNNVIRRVDAQGIIHLVAGGGKGSPFVGGPATSAALSSLSGIALDSGGNVVFSDGNIISKVDTNGILSVLAGGGPKNPGDGGPATNGVLVIPTGLAFDAVGNLFIAEQGAHRVREIHFAGSPTLTRTNVTAADAGTYVVIVTSPYGSVTNRVATVSVVLPALNVSLPGGAGGPLQLQLTGVPGATYVLETAETLTPPIPWQPAATSTADANGRCTFTDLNGANLPGRYYRLAPQ